MKLRLLLIALLAVVGLAACSGETAKQENGQGENVAKQNGDVNIKEMVNGYSTRALTAKSASITSDELIVTAENGKEEVYSLADEEFFVSIAPYVNTTHP
ncbi:hypothetical protein BN1002_03954 [Bacillus sp. B-jedd]|nr:hypothetical protein BN1002_03954 [Bacillus sp. B-jedd]